MDKTIELAREAGFKEHNGMVYVTTISDDCAKEIERLIALVRADQRQIDAKVCEDLPMQQEVDVRDQCAAAIRNRGNI
jgi:hypothetical protein